MSPMLHRPRRLRRHPVLRDAVAEVVLRPEQFMLPYFVVPGTGQDIPIPSMPGMARLSVDRLVEQVGRDLELGVRQVLLFGVPEAGVKDGHGGAAAHDDGLVPAAVRALRAAYGRDVLIATDVCLCAYTDHGHCGVVLGDGDAYRVDNDASLPHLAAMALAHARAGADIVAPSDMMDGRVGAIRQGLDDAGLVETGLMSYAVKYASAYYGPFRDAAASAPGQGGRESYQMDPRNRREAVREAALDEAEGADMLMVKPALAYLDIIQQVREHTTLPVVAYNVSGAFSMVKAAAAQGWIDERAVVMENLGAMARAGAQVLITYHARDVLAQRWL